MAEVMQMPQGFMAVAKSCLDEDYFLDIRLVTAHVVHQFLRIAGNILTGMQPKLLLSLPNSRLLGLGTKNELHFFCTIWSVVAQIID